MRIQDGVVTCPAGEGYVSSPSCALQSAPFALNSAKGANLLEGPLDDNGGIIGRCRKHTWCIVVSQCALVTMSFTNRSVYGFCYPLYSPFHFSSNNFRPIISLFSSPSENVKNFQHKSFEGQKVMVQN